MAEPYSDMPSGTVAKSRKSGSDQDRNIEMDVVEVSGVEAKAGSSAAKSDNPSGRRMSPVDDLKHRLSLWGESHTQPQPAESDEEGSEYELLLDPNLPEEYTRPLVPSIPSLHSHSDDDDEEKSGLKIYDANGVEEDSPYPEVRAACRNYDIEMPCNTVSFLAKISFRPVLIWT